MWLDSAGVARRAWHDCAERGYGLRDLAARFQITFCHHQAVEDARCAGLIVLRAIADTGIRLEDWVARVREPINGYPARIALPGCPDGPLFGEVIVFTGALSIDRGDAAKMAADAGCEVEAGVTRKTTILVIGMQDVRMLNGHEKSSKHRKAEKLIADGVSIRIISEPDFLHLVEGC